MPGLSFTFDLERGKPKDFFWRKVGSMFRGLKDGLYELEIRRKQARLSDPQRAYYFAVVVPMVAEETGYTKDQTHELLKARHLPKMDGNGVLVGELVIGGSITKLNRVQMSDYIEEIRQWSEGFLGCFIPPPNIDWRDYPDEATA